MPSARARMARAICTFILTWVRMACHRPLKAKPKPAINFASPFLRGSVGGVLIATMLPNRLLAEWMLANVPLPGSPLRSDRHSQPGAGCHAPTGKAVHKRLDARPAPPAD